MKKLFNVSIFFVLAVMVQGAFCQNPNSKKVIIISGGAARGAWGVGVVEYLIKSSGCYKAAFGTSTGSLTAPLTLLADTAKLKYVYTHVTQSSIFNVNPVKVDTATGADGQTVVTTSPRTFHAFWRLLWGKETLGETKPLRNLITTYFNQAEFDSIKNMHLDLNVAVANLTAGEGRIKSSATCTYADMCDWIWASANEPLLMSYLKKDDSVYVDGGVNQVIPVVNGLNYAFNNNMDTVDIIVNDSINLIDSWNGKGNWLTSGVARILDIMPTQISSDDISLAILLTELHDCSSGGSSKQGLTGGATTVSGSRIITLRIYNMPGAVANHDPDGLGFFERPMNYLFSQGCHHTPPPEVITVDEGSFDKAVTHLRHFKRFRGVNLKSDK